MNCGKKIAANMTPSELLARITRRLWELATMKIKLIDFGMTKEQTPYRPHGNDAGRMCICLLTVP